MEALAGRALGVEPSEMLRKVMGITGHDGAASVSEAFLSDLRHWDRGCSWPRDYEAIAEASSLHKLGVATADVLLYLVGICKEVKEQWQEAPPVTGLLPTLLFQFFGFFERRNVTSGRQLYMKAMNMRARDLPRLAGDDDECRDYLHGPCFEAPPVPRRSLTSSRESTASKDRREADRLVSERRRHQREGDRVDAKKAELDAARVETTQQTADLRTQRQDQTLAESRRR